MIYLEKVRKEYQNTVAVDELTLEVQAGNLCVLVGPSGCGKTTTLRMINRLVQPTAGRIFINGEDSSVMEPEKLRRSIGYAIQGVGLFPHMNVAANIAVVPQLLRWGKARIYKRVDELLALVGLDPQEYAVKYPHELSGGEAQRIGVARALAADPPILLMDEPFGAVDPLTRERLQTQFLRIQRELRKTIILVTHDLDEAIRLADLLAIMRAGKLVQYDTPEKILNKPANKFVHDFVGTDRALKRLSRITVDAYLRPATTIKINESMQQVRAACRGCRWVWVIDDNGRLAGWIDTSTAAQAETVREIVIWGNPDQIAVNNNASLREALSSMLGQGFNNIPVIDEGQHLLGEIGLQDIEIAMAGSQDESAQAL